MFIVYGYDPSIYDIKEPVILIEPRKRFIDKIKKDNITLVTKILMDKNILRTVDLYNDNTVIEKPPSLSSKEIVYTTSLTNVIKMYNIKSIECLIINIDIDNISSVLDNAIAYNHIIKKIKGNVKECELLKYFIKNDNSEYCHKNLGLEIPNICLYTTPNVECVQNNSPEHKFLNFIDRYNMIVLVNGKLYKGNNINFKKQVSKIDIYDYISENLQKILLNECLTINDKKIDIIIQFNPDYLIMNDIFEIKYPLEDNILHVKKSQDIIYGNKNTMCMLYNMLKSDEFKIYIEEKKALKGKLYKFFSKTFFYEYLHKHFNIKE